MQRDIERIKRFCREMDNAEQDITVRGKQIFDKNNQLLVEY
jgi:hypothetical protein